jgi:hypothetical protein
MGRTISATSERSSSIATAVAASAGAEWAGHMKSDPSIYKGNQGNRISK